MIIKKGTAPQNFELAKSASNTPCKTKFSFLNKDTIRYANRKQACPISREKSADKFLNKGLATSKSVERAEIRND